MFRCSLNLSEPDEETKYYIDRTVIGRNKTDKPNRVNIYSNFKIERYMYLALKQKYFFVEYCWFLLSNSIYIDKLV